jgi:hypothetical protein
VNTKQKGDIAEGHVLAAFLKAGKTVLMPFGDRNRYDMVVDEGGKFTRIQVKHGRIRNGAVEFNTCSVSTEKGKPVSRSYAGEIDAFAVWCSDNEKVYIVEPEWCGKRETRLMLKESRHANQFPVLTAAGFEFSGPISSTVEHPTDNRKTTVRLGDGVPLS